MVWVPKAFLEGWNRRLDLHISLLTRGKPNTIAVAGCWLVENATSSIHGNVFPVASNSLDVVRGSCACVCVVRVFFSFFFFFVLSKGLSLSREHLPLLVVSM